MEFRLYYCQLGKTVFTGSMPMVRISMGRLYVYLYTRKGLRRRTIPHPSSYSVVPSAQFCQPTMLR